MERSLAVVWTCLLGAGLALALPPAITFTTPKTEPRPPRLIDCVFLNRANVTCRWEAGDTPTTHYTLKVERKSKGSTTFSCNTSDTSCTAITGSSVRFTFCISITAHGGSGDITSHPRCQSGRTEVMLPPVTLKSVKPVGGRPQCLDVIWNRTWSVFPVSDSEIKAGNLNSQIEFTAHKQFNNVQVSNVTVTDYSFMVCLFRPDTSYTVRLRHRYKGPESPWSPWSRGSQGRTGEDAPSAAPAFWRRVEPADENGRRLISLLWKHLPHSVANGRVRFFNVTCQTESAQVLNDRGGCRDLHHTSTSCSLLLPPERCSCALTASTSAGTSPEARLWFLGASETEPPPPSQISVSPLNSSSFDVRWTAPVDPSASGFMVEWFAVREKNSSILHWERLNSSCAALVITEGVKPMEHYVVSVKVLYGERGAGQNKSVHNYTRQGVPSAGPNVQVHQVSGSTVELIWAPVPVELCHGFIRNYTIYYTTENQPTSSVSVPGHAHRYSLEGLPPDNYDIFMQANTDAGAGAAGPITNVHIGSDEISIVMYAVLLLILTLLAPVLMACLVHMVKQKLRQDVPDPSSSSLAHWTPKTTLEIMKQPAIAEKTEIKYSEVILLGESELQNSDPDQNVTYQSVCALQTYSSHCYSPLKVSEAQTPQNTRKLEKYAKSSTKARTTSNTDLSSCPSIYSNVLFSQTLKRLPTPLLSPSFVQSNDWLRSTISINDVKPKLGGYIKPPVSLRDSGTASATISDSPLSPTDELKTFRHFLRQHQSPVSFSNFNSISYSSVLLSHPAEVTSPQHLFSQSLYNSVPLLEPDTFTRPGAPSDTFTTSLSPFPHSLFVDFSYCPVKCDPYISPAV